MQITVQRITTQLPECLRYTLATTPNADEDVGKLNYSWLVGDVKRHSCSGKVLWKLLKTLNMQLL